MVQVHLSTFYAINTMNVMDPNERQKLKRNVSVIYWYSFFVTFLVAIPIIVPYWEKFGLSVKEVFILQGIFGAVLIICDVPAGYVADLFGRKITMVIGSVVTALSFQILWMGSQFWHFAIFEALTGV